MEGTPEKKPELSVQERESKFREGVVAMFDIWYIVCYFFFFVLTF